MNAFLEESIKEKLNIKSKKVQLILSEDEKEIERVLKEEEYTINYINFQNNSINGTIKKNDIKYFFKMLNKKDFLNEINGYIQIRDILPVNKVKEIIEFKNYNIIIFEYENTITNNKGLLNDFFVENDLNSIYFSRKNYISIIDLYKKSYSKTVIRNEYPMQQFFEKRIDSRLKKWYKKEKLFNYDITINGISSTKTKEIIKECINFFKLKCNQQCALTQGDPNTLNIGIKPIFFDFSTAGYNPIICELSSIFWSILIADAYFCPKYHSKSYLNHEKVLKNIKEFTPNLKYEVNDVEKKINIQSDIKTSRVRTDFMIDYINMLEKLGVKMKKEIKYFMIMRVLCIFDIRKMDKMDYFYSLFMVHYLYENILEDSYTSLKNIIDKFNIIGGK